MTCLWIRPDAVPAQRGLHFPVVGGLENADQFLHPGNPDRFHKPVKQPLAFLSPEARTALGDRFGVMCSNIPRLAVTALAGAVDPLDHQHIQAEVGPAATDAVDREKPAKIDDLLRDQFVDRAACDAWLARWRARLAQTPWDDGTRQAAMCAASPKYVLRNWLAEGAIRKAQDGDFSEVGRLLACAAFRGNRVGTLNVCRPLGAPHFSERDRTMLKLLLPHYVQALQAAERETMRHQGEGETLPTLGLTKREVQVAAWLARGRTNGEIARILAMQPRTVEKHVERILIKLGVENRTAAAMVVGGRLAYATHPGPELASEKAPKPAVRKSRARRAPPARSLTR